MRAYEPPDGFPKVFCSACGSALWSRSPVDPDVISVRLGSFDGDPGIRPSFRNYVAYAAPWEPIPDDGLAALPGAEDLGEKPLDGVRTTSDSGDNGSIGSKWPAPSSGISSASPSTPRA